MGHRDFKTTLIYAVRYIRRSTRPSGSNRPSKLLANWQRARKREPLDPIEPLA